MSRFCNRLREASVTYRLCDASVTRCSCDTSVTGCVTLCHTTGMLLGAASTVRLGLGLISNNDAGDRPFIIDLREWPLGALDTRNEPHVQGTSSTSAALIYARRTQSQAFTTSMLSWGYNGRYM
eukprot:1178289-Prorocentrum_minimum.AAC.1